MLMNSCASLHATDLNGWTPMHWAAMRGHDSVLPQLIETIEGQVTISAVDHWGSTPLHWAALHGHFKFVNLLLRDSNQQVLPHALAMKNAQDKTASDLARAYRHHNVARVLDAWEPLKPDIWGNRRAPGAQQQTPSRPVGGTRGGRAVASAPPAPAKASTTDEQEVVELKAKFGIGTAAMLASALMRAKKRAQMNASMSVDSRLERQASLSMKRQERTTALPCTPLQRRAMTNVVSFDETDAPVTVHQVAIDRRLR